MSESYSTSALPPLPTPHDGVEYRHIEGHPGYAVSSDGKVWSCKQLKGNGGRGGTQTIFVSSWHVMRPWKTVKHGYQAIMLRTGGKRYARKVYHLVLEAFLGPRPEGLDACHCNGDVTDNSLSNLRWDTRKNNMADKKEHGTHLIGSRCHTARITEETAVEIKRLLAAGVRNMHIAKQLGVTVATIEPIKAGVTWTHVSTPDDLSTVQIAEPLQMQFMGFTWDEYHTFRPGRCMICIESVPSKVAAMRVLRRPYAVKSKRICMGCARAIVGGS